MELPTLWRVGTPFLVTAILTTAALGGVALSPVPIREVKIDDPFWSPKRDVWRKVTISDCFDKFEKDGALTNFDKVRDGRGGEHGGPPWYDGLVYETITGAADFMVEQPDPQLQRRIDGYIERIAAAKDPDGYINTYTQLKEPTHRWGTNGGNDRWQHDLYNAGCLVEAAVHYYRATGKTELLRVATRLANHMCDVMGPPPRKNIIPGHAIGELSFTELYQLFRDEPGLKKQIPFAVDESHYLSLAQFWIDSRGNHAGRESFGAYDQDDRPVVQQEAIEGHAVRATLMAAGLTALASTTGREDYRTTARRLWENMVGRRMYVTGGVGAIAGDEKFGDDYVLPNNGYLETCAAVGAGFFHHRMNLETGDARCADELERVLYNGALCGVSLSGDRYFYENPLEGGKNRLRWVWHACPCCPPMLLKLMGALPGYVYATDSKGLYVNLYAGSSVHTTVAGTPVTLRQTTRYPWEGNVRLTIESDQPAEFDLNLRVPGWCLASGDRKDLYTPVGRPQSAGFVVNVNGEVISPALGRGYATIHRRWSRGDVVEITMQMPPVRLRADPNVAADAGRVALARGPIVYCLESVDNNGHVRNLSLPDDSELQAEFRPELLGGVAVLRAKALASVAGGQPRPVELTAIPYYANANRGPVSMCVWMPRSATDALPAESVIRVNARGPGRPVSPYLTGACIEDVNHVVYGGIYSQMLFGESFQEPPRREPVKGFVAVEGEWSVEKGELVGGAGAGPKLLSTVAPFTDGEVGVEVLLPGGGGGNAGLIVRVARAGAGADNFDGYEISLDAARKRLVLGRHHHDFRLLREEPCEIVPNHWTPLTVHLDQRTIDISINGKSVLRFEDDHPLGPGTIGLRQWNRPAKYRKLWVRTLDRRTEMPFKSLAGDSIAVRGMWDAIVTDTAKLSASIEKERPFTGNQSQRITFAGGAGEVGVANRGLNHQGVACVEGKPYEGYLWLRADQPTELFVGLESRDGSRSYATAELSVQAGEWRRYDFTLTPIASDANCRFSIKLKSPGTVILGHAFLQPGEWGRFKGLPLRKDVVDGLINQGITVLRYGGSMVNAPEYRWKKMIGPRDRRPPYRGTWYPNSSNGWGIIDFLDLCEAAGFLGVPAFNMDESPADMADFIEYVNGPAESEWGRRRAADGHPKPYGLKYLELGNEERVDERYAQKFAALTRAIWANDPQVIPVVGDFAYDAPIDDPMHITRAASRITSLSGQQQILKFVKEQGREVWFDVHVWTEGPAPYPSLTALPTYIDAIDRLADGAKHKVVVFELNATNHSQKRAVGNAQALGVAMRDGRLPIVTSANCLQVDGQNDNGWDQGLLFLNPSKVWLQPPGYVTRMLRQAYQPTVIDAAVQPTVKDLDVTGTRSEDGKQIVLRVVNIGAEPQSASIAFDGFEPRQEVATVERLAAGLDTANTADALERVVPQKSEWRHKTTGGRSAALEFPPHSLTVLRLQ